jgi:hypothetical protein
MMIRDTNIKNGKELNNFALSLSEMWSNNTIDAI